MAILPLTDPVLTDAPLWRRMQYGTWVRIKHWFGIHTYTHTLHPVFSNAELVSIQLCYECWVCGKLA